MGFISGIIKAATKIGGIASKYASKSGVIGKIAGGVAKAANLVRKYTPSVVRGVRSVYNIAKPIANSSIANKITKGRSGQIFAKIDKHAGRIINEELPPRSTPTTQTQPTDTGQIM